MEELAEMLEEELAQAVEVKDRKSLHRYVLLITQQHVDQRSFDTQTSELAGSIEKAIQSMHEGFERMDERFNGMQKQMDERFNQMDQRFAQMQKQMDERFKQTQIQFEQVQKQIDERFKQTQIQFEQVQKRIDERCAAQERRFEDMNKRFDDMNERFNGMQKLIGIGFAAMGLIISSFNLALFFS